MLSHAIIVISILLPCNIFHSNTLKEISVKEYVDLFHLCKCFALSPYILQETI